MPSSARSRGGFQRPHVLWLLASILAVLNVLASHAPSASATVKSFEVEAYGQALDLPSGVARDDLEVQAKGGEVDIAGALEERLRDEFAGIWFDSESAEYVVLMTSDNAGDAVGKEMASAQLTADYRTAVVKYSWDELKAAQSQIDSRLSAFFDAGLIYTSIDPRTNAVVVHVGSATSEKEDVTLLQIAEGIGGQVELRATNVDRFQGARDACSNIVPNCGRPFRGGVEIGPWKGPNAGICTAGFLATGDADGQRYLLTAGHCAAEKNPGNPTIHWQALDEQKLPFYGQPNYLGAVSQLAFPAHDWMKINASETWWDQVRPWPTMVAYWQELSVPNPIDAEYPILGEASSIVGQGVCHSGMASGGSCGQVTETNVSFNFGEPGNTTYDLVKVKGACSDGGDSGGPWFASNIAYGIHIGKDTAFDICGSKTFYQDVTDVTNALGVTIKPPPPPPPAAIPPTVQTTPATNIKDEEATLNGTLNPNGWETTYYFEFGKTAAYGSRLPAGPPAGAGAGKQTMAMYLPVALQPRTQYHYRLVATNAGGTSYGADHLFTTGVRWLLRNYNTSGNSEVGFWHGLPSERQISGDWDGNGTVTSGSVNTTTGVWKLRNSITTGKPDLEFQYGGAVWTEPVVGDWNNDGKTTVGVYDPTSNTWKLRNSNSPGSADIEFNFSLAPGAKVISGDWNGDGTTTVGLYNPTGTFRIRTTNASSSSSTEIAYGGAMWTEPVVGDWNADGKTTIGVYDPASGVWRLRNQNSAGSAEIELTYGGVGGGPNILKPLSGDWDGNGTDTVALAKVHAETLNEWRLRNTNSSGHADVDFEFDVYGAQRITGDWDGDGKTTAGTYNPQTGIWKLRNSNTSGYADIEFNFSLAPGAKVISGDWNGDGTTTVGLYNPTGTFRIRTTNASSSSSTEIAYGGAIWTEPVVGDWNGDGKTTIGVFDPKAGVWRLRNQNSAGAAEIEAQFGGAVWTTPVTGDWNGDGKTTIGVFDSSATNNVWRLRNTITAGNADIEAQFGGDVWSPIVGDWNGDGIDTVGVVTR